MKTIILCGGKGTRLREETEFKPKPIVEIGGYPILLHIMDIYAHYGHKEFILCLGYKSEMIKEYFLNLSKFNDDLEMDMVSGQVVCLKKCANYDYKIIFAETGEDTQTAERIRLVRSYIKNENLFMVTYGDGLSDINIDKLINFHKKQQQKFGICATISAVHPSSKYGKIQANKNDIIKEFNEKPVLKDYINGGFMVFSKQALRYLKNNEMLETSILRMVKDGKLSQFTHEGFWHSMDTMKDIADLNNLWETTKPWPVSNNFKS